MTQVVALGSAGVVLALIEPHGAPGIEVPPLGRSSRVFNSTQMVRDLSETLRFYKEVLG